MHTLGLIELADETNELKVVYGMVSVTGLDTAH